MIEIISFPLPFFLILVLFLIHFLSTLQLAVMSASKLTGTKGDGKSSKSPGSDSATTPIHRPSLFSPPLSASEMALADARVAALSNYTVPNAYDASFTHQPDALSVMVHSLPSSGTDAGFQAVIVLHPKSILPPHLGLTAFTRLEETALLMTSLPNEPFVMYHQASKGMILQISVTEYLTLLNFFVKEWPRLKSKLLTQTEKMRDGQDPVPLSQHLAFYSHGCCLYSIALSPRLVFKVRADSKKPTARDEHLSAWLEQRSDNQWIEFGLALQSLATLSQNTHTVKTLTDLVAQYKNRSRKRNKSVATCP